MDQDNVQSYSQFYKIHNPPKKLIENIEFDVCIDGENKKIKYEFPLEYKITSTCWEEFRRSYWRIKGNCMGTWGGCMGI